MPSVRIRYVKKIFLCIWGKYTAQSPQEGSGLNSHEALYRLSTIDTREEEVYSIDPMEDQPGQNVRRASTSSSRYRRHPAGISVLGASLPTPDLL